MICDKWMPGGLRDSAKESYLVVPAQKKDKKYYIWAKKLSFMDLMNIIFPLYRSRL